MRWCAHLSIGLELADARSVAIDEFYTGILNARRQPTLIHAMVWETHSLSPPPDPPLTLAPNGRELGESGGRDKADMQLVGLTEIARSVRVYSAAGGRPVPA